MKRYIVFALLLAMLMAPATMDARKKKDKKMEKRGVSIENVNAAEQPMQDVAVTNPAQQLYGEWDIITMRKKKVYSLERAYLYLDFKGGNKVYGNNGCNTINGTFQLSGNNLKFSDFISSGESCHNVTSEKTIMHTLADVRRYTLQQQYNAQYMNLMNSKGAVIMVLKRHNLDAMNGVWLVKEINSENVSEKNMRLVIDAVMQTIHGDTGCNIINGIITLDPTKDMAIQFEDLRSTEHDCEDIDFETDLLLALETTESCKRINQYEMALLDHKGSIVLMLQRINLRQTTAEND
ncbi:MAG: META domain-containing protein [Bacteroidales bacterium]|jgi:heat shock protein HslJ|nr:META domain-containing protein [Bacteroidales bacterium]MBQ1583477.1 META domain-containing protein [Muribaculaceae bacterium]